MTMPGGLNAEFTTLERCEYLLTVLACCATGKKSTQFIPWCKSGLEEFAQELSNG